MVTNACAIRHCGYKFANHCSAYPSTSFCYDVVAKHRSQVVSSESFFFTFKYGYMLWRCQVQTSNASDGEFDLPEGWQLLQLRFPLDVQPLSEWAVHWHDLVMKDGLSGEVSIYRRDVLWKLPSHERALVNLGQ